MLPQAQSPFGGDWVEQEGSLFEYPGIAARGKVAKLGFEWIQAGHGLGVNAIHESTLTMIWPQTAAGSQ